MANHCILNYSFPTFGLSVTHDSCQLIKSEFYNLNEKRQPLIGAANELTNQIIAQLDAYAKDGHFVFNLPLAINGTEHQQKVWQIMLGLKSGQTLSYGEVAREIGSAPRAVGGACGKNPLPVFIPCHRIVGSKLSLGGFNSGNIFFNLGIKQWLLAHEGILIK